MNAQRPHCSVIVAMLALAIPAAPACDVDPGAESSAIDTTTADGQVMLRLGRGQDTGPLALLEAEFEVEAGADENLDESILEGVQMVGISFDDATDRQATAWGRLAKAAVERGLPVVLEGADGDQMADAVGIGVNADAVAITPENYGYRLTILGGQDDALVAATQQLAVDEALGEPVTDVIPATAEDFVATVGDALHAPGFRSGPGLGSGISRQYRYFYVDMLNVSWTITPGSSSGFLGGGDPAQIASADVDFEAELALDEAKGQKMLFIRPVGSGFHPGSLSANHSGRRGYFTERLDLDIEIDSSDVLMYDHAPSTPVSVTTYTSTTGLGVSFGGLPPTVSFSSSEQTKVDLPSFTVVNNTVNNKASWEFKMSESGSALFEGWPSCDVKGVTAVATSNLLPEAEAIYRSTIDFTGSVDVELSTTFNMLELAGGQEYVWSCRRERDRKSLEVPMSFRVNFAAIGDVPLADATAALTTYGRDPIMNPWHQGQVSETASGELRWENAAGVSWSLTPDLENLQLLTGPDCPYYNAPGGDAFTLEVSDSDVTGFWFQNEFYGVRTTPAIDRADLLGGYVHTGFDLGVILESEDGSLVWNHHQLFPSTSLTSCGLTEDLDNGLLFIDPNCSAYDASARSVIALEFLDNGTFAGVSYNGNLYRPQ